jgi:hypothetical protein
MLSDPKSARPHPGATRAHILVIEDDPSIATRFEMRCKEDG